MAIEITSKSKIEKINWLKIILIAVLILFLVFSLSYFILFFYQTKLNKRLSDLKTKLERTSEQANLEQDVLHNKKQIENWKIVAPRYVLALKIFEFLEKNTHPQVWHFGFEMDFDRAILQLNSQADSLKTLNQQLLIFEKNEFVKTTTLSDINIKKEEKREKVLFNLQLDFDPKIFSPLF